MYTRYMFRTIPEFPTYEASNDGQIRGKQGGRRSNRPLKHQLSYGYHTVGLYRDGKIHRVRVHRIVLSAWKGPCPAGMDGLHKDDDKDNNTVRNLYWGTPKQNSSDAKANGKNPWSRRDRCVNGHRFDAVNTYWRPDGRGRCCKKCMYDRNAARRRSA